MEMERSREEKRREEKRREERRRGWVLARTRLRFGTDLQDLENNSAAVSVPTVVSCGSAIICLFS